MYMTFLTYGMIMLFSEGDEPNNLEGPVSPQEQGASARK